MLIEIAKWILIGIGALVGSIILYIGGWNILASIAPHRVEKYHLHFAILDIKKHFGFLFAKGLEKIASTMKKMMNGFRINA